MKSSLICFAALIMSAPLQVAHAGILDSPDNSGRTVEIVRSEAGTMCTLIIEDESLHRLLTEITERLGIELEGFEGIKRNALVSAHLRNRPLRQALEYVLGSVGLRYSLRTNALTVLDNSFESTTRGELLQLASAAYLRAQARFPGHPLAPGARLNQGHIEEKRKNYVGALEHFQVVREKYATSPRFPEALLYAGKMHAELEQWGEASLTFRELINLQTTHDFGAAGLLGLARSLIRLNDEGTAIHVLSLLERNFPQERAKTLTEHNLLLSEALLGTDENIECLRVLERLESTALADTDLTTVHMLRARAFESLEMMSEAGRAWLLYAQSAEASKRDAALVRAAQLALDSGDELAVLFIAHNIDSAQLRNRLTPFVQEANARLGLATADNTESLTFAERIDLAEGHIRAKDNDKAKSVLIEFFDRRGGLTRDLRVRFTLTWSVILEQSTGYEDAIAFLGQERPQLELLSDRSRIDVRAAGILEEHGLLDEAIEAFGGKY